LRSSQKEPQVCYDAARAARGVELFPCIAETAV
jgi:hypothetical protein